MRRSEDSEAPRGRSQSSSSSSSEAPQDDKETNPLPAPDPSLTHLFSDAASYGQILNMGLNTHTDVAENNAEDRRAAHDSPNGFSQLVARDLNDQERVASETLARLSVSNWAPGESTDLAPDVAVDESEEGPSEGEHDKIEPSGTPHTGEEPKFEDRLKPDEVLDLLQQEFGALAPPGEEKLLLETDVSLFQEVVILGVVHLTTHRLTFHASLLSSQPGQKERILKSGPVIVHYKGLRRKKRVWLQLTREMICTYPSSRDEHRIKPLRSILFSSVKDVKPAESKYPRHLNIVFDSNDGIVDSIVEFDTDESAQDWRRELLGALFLYRRDRHLVLMDDKEDLNAVRINIPLSRVNSVEKLNIASFAGLITVTFDPKSSNGTSQQQPTSNTDDQEVINLHETAPEKQVLQFGILRENPQCEWVNVKSYIDKARTSASSDNIDWPGSRVHIDVDPRINESTETSNNNLSNLVKSVSFSLGLDASKEIWIRKAHLHRLVVSYSGHIAVNAECVGFWSKSVTGPDIRYRVPLSRINVVKPQDRGHGRGCGYTLAIEIQGRHDLRLEFSTEEKRDEAIEQINRFVGLSQEHSTAPLSISPGSSTIYPNQSDESWADRRARSPEQISESHASPEDTIPRTSHEHTVPPRNPTSILAPLSRVPTTVHQQRVPHHLKSLFPKAINVPEGVLLSIPSKHFVCLTIGSRGDVQPYIALGRGLQKEGHKVTIVTHEEYKAWVTGFGINHRTAGGDPGALMKLSVENKMFSPQFFKEGLSNFRSWLDQLFVDSWEQCQDADVLLESPSAMAGVHIAEALHIPYFRTFTMPWTKTKQFPHAFLAPPVDSPTFNAASYVLFDNVFWTATSSQVNRWRKHTLGIGHTDMGHLAQSKIPFIYNFSTAVVPKPLDWGDATAISGYWFLDNPELGWTPPQTLVDWIAKARADGKPIVYIGFGSITVPNPKLVTERIIRGVLKSGVRAIVSKGWSARMSKGGNDDVVLPEECYALEKVPHDWLFPQIDAALHHGGAGTTGASLRAGIPTLIRPWFGDQFFWASRVQKLGAGIKLNSLHSKEVALALKKATTDRVIKEKAANVGERIRQEDGVHTAISTIYTYLPRAGRDRKTIEH